MTFEAYRTKTGKFVLVSNVILVLLIIFLFAFNGFSGEEITELFKYLVPIKALYLTAVIKFVLAQQKDLTATKASNNSVQPLFKTMTSCFLYTHISILYLFILLGAFNAISFDFLINILLIIETFFGVYIGTIIGDLFAVKSSQ